MLSLPEEINGENICLLVAKATPENAKTLFRLVIHNRDKLAPYFRYLVAQITNQKRAFDYLNEAEKSQTVPQTIYFIQKDEKKIGILSMAIRMDTAVVGYWIDKNHMRQGIITEALRLFEREAFGNGCRSIQLNIAPINTPALMLAYRSGYYECPRSSAMQVIKCFEKTKQMYDVEQQGLTPHCILSQNDLETSVYAMRLDSMHLNRQ